MKRILKLLITTILLLCGCNVPQKSILPTETPPQTATITPTFTSIPPTATFTPRPTNTPEPTAIPTSNPIPEGFEGYTVREGENCWSIARDHGISEEYFRQINNMDNCNIGIGDVVIVPKQ